MHEFSKTILIVDDEPDLTDIIRSSLEDNGYQVIEANSGRVAANILESEKIDIVLTDLKMSDGDGLRVRDKAKFKKIPYIFLTAYSGAYKTFLPKDALVLEKPYDLKEILDAIQRLTA